MVTLSNPDPQFPVQDRRFSITATDGSPDYTFSWQVDEGELHQKTQSDPTLTIHVPAGSQGELLHISVTDGNGASADDQWRITVGSQE